MPSADVKLCDGAQSRQWVFTVRLCYPLHLLYTGTAPGSYSQVTSMGVWGQDLGCQAPRIILMYLWAH